ncbi:geranylgeranylglyceryl/heptaprenylglyceryl phosphate synthase [Flavobacteriaceae bacterium S356]|uniref:Geranylgeranylglyceryl phosphate synthase n=1 Tax=Asprobacillus argus TaxID=3076534 RepID=A0ABU3LCV6_9FLAO|nr:geranylgeranylglyceryl/heptaprenylglyceryl phosphate synthase [Flavobacteriaceae bacterium S356]
MNIYTEIVAAKKKGQKLLAVLIDPEKMKIGEVHSFIKLVNASVATHIFVGGSTDVDHQIEHIVTEIKKYTILPVILFPGDFSQVTTKADGVLFLSLISGRNSEYLITQQIAAVPKLKKSSLEVIPTGYLLIDGGIETSVQRTSNTNPLPQKDLTQILHTALAGEYMGNKLIYLEAGSGANIPVSPAIINALSNELNDPLLVGGGIRTIGQLNQAYEAGADMVVIGTAFEQNTAFFNELKKEITNENIR